jgi:hypothetical protein
MSTTKRVKSFHDIPSEKDLVSKLIEIKKCFNEIHANLLDSKRNFDFESSLNFDLGYLYSSTDKKFGELVQIIHKLKKVNAHEIYQPIMDVLKIDPLNASSKMSKNKENSRNSLLKFQALVWDQIYKLSDLIGPPHKGFKDILKLKLDSFDDILFQRKIFKYLAKFPTILDAELLSSLTSSVLKFLKAFISRIPIEKTRKEAVEIEYDKVLEVVECLAIVFESPFLNFLCSNSHKIQIYEAFYCMIPSIENNLPVLRAMTHLIFNNPSNFSSALPLHLHAMAMLYSNQKKDYIIADFLIRPRRVLSTEIMIPDKSQFYYREEIKIKETTGQPIPSNLRQNLVEPVENQQDSQFPTIIDENSD